MAESGFEPTGDLDSRSQILLCSPPPPPLLSKKWWLSNQKQYIQCMRNASSESHVQNPDHCNVGSARPATSAAQSALVTDLGDYSQSLLLSQLYPAVIILMFFQQLWGKKKTWFCFLKRREPEICILGFISNPYKNTCLESILIKFHLEMTDGCNRPIWSQFLQQHKM